MKANVEAWQAGSEDGWDDGYNDRQPKENFTFPDGWTYMEKENYKQGYNDGYDQGSADC